MNPSKEIKAILSRLEPSEAISIVERIGKELRRANSIRLSKGGIKNVIDAERPDLIKLKNEKD